MLDYTSSSCVTIKDFLRVCSSASHVEDESDLLCLVYTVNRVMAKAWVSNRRHMCKICTYVCIVCMYVSMYVCMYVLQNLHSHLGS